MILEPNPIPGKVAQLRKLKGQMDALKVKYDVLKAELYPLVEATEGTKWTDKKGYARIVSREPSISYNSKALESLYKSVPSVASVIGPHRKERPGGTYLKVK